MATYDGDPQDYQPLIEGGYTFDLGAYLSRGWEILKENVAGFIAYVFIFMIISGVMGVIGSMMGFGSSLVGFIMKQLTNIPVVGLSAGFIIVAHKIAKNEEYEFGNFFDGLKDMIQLWLGSFVSGILSTIPILIGVYLAVGPEIYSLFETFQDTQYMVNNYEEVFATLTPYGAKIGIYGGIGLLVSMLVSLLYSFTSPLILFGRLKFWDAMEVSRKIISQKLISFILLWLVVGLSFMALCAIPAFIAGAMGSGLMGAFAGLIIFSGVILFIPYVSCLTYGVYESVVLENLDGE